VKTSVWSRFASYLGTTQAILVGLAAGLILGLFLGPSAGGLKPVGTAFISLLKLVVIPLVFVSITVGVYQTGTLARLGTIGMRTVVYYLSTTSIAIVVGMILVSIVKPGVGVTLESSGFQPEAQAMESLMHFFTRLIPDNVFVAFTEMNILGIIIIAIALGVALIFSGDNGKRIMNFVSNTRGQLLNGRDFCRLNELRLHIEKLPIGDAQHLYAQGIADTFSHRA